MLGAEVLGAEVLGAEVLGAEVLGAEVLGAAVLVRRRCELVAWTKGEAWEAGRKGGMLSH